MSQASDAIPEQQFDRKFALALDNLESDESPAQYYERMLNALLLHAEERKNIVVLVDALAWLLARIMVYHRMFGVGDVLRRLGSKIFSIAEQQEAQAQAATAKREGESTQ